MKYSLVLIGVMLLSFSNASAQNRWVQAEFIEGYIHQLDSVATQDSAKLENAALYYYKIHDFKKPMTYFFRSDNHPDRSYYWKLSSNRKEQTLTTEWYSTAFEKLERFVEKYDSVL